MKTRIALGGAFASAAVLVGAWEAGQTSATSSTQAASVGSGSSDASSESTSTGSDTPTDTSSTGTSTDGTFADPTPASTPSPSSSATSTGAYKNGTFTGSTVSTRFGDIQVSVTVASGKITAVTALHLTDDDGRSVEISAQAAPLLEQEVLTAQSAQVDTIGGATYTSDGYLQSLQAALDQAN